MRHTGLLALFLSRDLLVTLGKNNVANRIGTATTSGTISYGGLGIGTSSQSPAITDTDIVAGGVYADYSTQTMTDGILTTVKSAWAPTPATYVECVLCQSSTQHSSLILSRSLMTSVTIVAGDTLTVTHTVTVS